MDYKLIALDIDGTLTNSQKEITPRTRYALMEAQKQGKKTGETMVSKLFPLEYLPDIVNVLKDSNITINTYDDRRIISDNKVNDYTYVERDVIKAEMVVVDDFISSVRFDINKILLAGEPDELDKYQKILADRYDGLLDVYKSAPYFLEIMPFGVTKGSMLPLLLDKLKIKREELAAFGDNYNDMTMIGYAGFGVAMGNAETDVKKIADYICESNDNDGIANTLDKFILKQ